jgi:hypothetical protein
VRCAGSPSSSKSYEPQPFAIVASSTPSISSLAHRSPTRPRYTEASLSTASASSGWPTASWNSTPPQPFATTTAISPAGAGIESSIVTARPAARSAVTRGGCASRNSTPAQAAGPSQPVWITSPRFATTCATRRIRGRSSSIHLPSEAAISRRCRESK